MINRRKSFIFAEKIKEMDRGFEILINMLVGQYGHEWDAERDARIRRYRRKLSGI